MLRTTNKLTRDETQNSQATKNEENEDAAASAGDIGGDKSIKNLSIVVKSAKSKKPNFIKANSGTDFLTPGAKEAFIHLYTPTKSFFRGSNSLAFTSKMPYPN